MYIAPIPGILRYEIEPEDETVTNDGERRDKQAIHNHFSAVPASGIGGNMEQEMNAHTQARQLAHHHFSF